MSGRHASDRPLDYSDSHRRRPWPPRLPQHRVLEARTLDHSPGLGYAQSVQVSLEAIAQAAYEARARMGSEWDHHHD